jgi:hypothetical protein
MSEERWRPRWWLLGSYGATVVVHLVASGGWTTTTTVMAPISLALTLVFVFARRLPWWLTGDGRDLRAAGRRPEKRRSALRWRYRTATTLLWATAVLTLGGEVAVIVAVGGWLPWVLPVAGLVAVLVLAGWRSDLGVAARCFASDSWTPVTAAAFDVRPGEPVNGWAVLPGDVRIRFHLPAVPADIAAELAGRRRLWLAGWPSEYLVTGLPEGTSYAVGLIGEHRRGGKNTVTRAPVASVSSPS